MAGVRSVLGLCPTWHDQVDAKILREVEAKFEKDFPFYVSLRHAIAHAAELWDHPAKIDKNRPKGEPLIVDSLMNGHYVTSFEGRQVSYRIHSSTVEGINALTRDFYGAFVSLDPYPATLGQFRTIY